MNISAPRVATCFGLKSSLSSLPRTTRRCQRARSDMARASPYLETKLDFPEPNDPTTMTCTCLAPVFDTRVFNIDTR